MRLLLLATILLAAPRAVQVRGEVVDADTGRPLPCRIYIQKEDGSWHFPKSAGTAVEYRKQNKARPESVEMHTTLSAHPFTADLPPGTYAITVERGKEYLPETRQLEVADKPVELTFRLRRWVDMTARGWYSGDTHVHRTLEDLPNVMLAEDLNAAFPLLSWVTQAFASPKSKVTGEPPPADPIAVDATHVIHPRNTEYEIFTVNGKSHTLGAFFVLGHKTLFEEGVPPVGPVVRKARAEGALLELDKHNWPWSMMLVPVANIDLYELTNNHVWRTEFGFRAFGAAEADWMNVERDDKGWTERGWIDFGFKNYYLLLNCGFRLRPTAGTASGVHPVPLGFGRVYVRMKDTFTLAGWLRGLNEGRSFVTTGPMLQVEVNGEDPGHVFRAGKDFRVRGTATAAVPLDRIEIVVNGEVVRTIKPENRETPPAGYASAIDETLAVEASSWIAVRCFEERPDRRVRFAHTGPFHVEREGRPLLPRRAEVEYLVKRVEDELARHAGVLPEPALEEYRAALRVYRELLR